MSHSERRLRAASLLIDAVNCDRITMDTFETLALRLQTAQNASLCVEECVLLVLSPNEFKVEKQVCSDTAWII